MSEGNSIRERCASPRGARVATEFGSLAPMCHLRLIRPLFREGYRWITHLKIWVLTRLTLL
jgi:hypothetical protein